jgi:hypothetical protein
MNELADKKRLMYVTADDYYLLCYSLFIMLDTLTCVNGKYFSDHRKLGFLLNIISNDHLINNLNNNSPIDNRDHFFSAYSKGLLKKNDVTKILFSLEKKGFLHIRRGKTVSSLDVSLDKKNIPSSFFDENLFSAEYKNTQILKKLISRLSSLKLETMLERLYGDNGVKVWAI